MKTTHKSEDELQQPETKLIIQGPNRSTITRNLKWEEKHGLFMQLISNISQKTTWMWLRKGNFKREMVSLLSSTKQRYKNQSYQSKHR